MNIVEGLVRLLVSRLLSSIVVPFSDRLISSGERVAANIYLLSKSCRKKTKKQHFLLISSRERCALGRMKDKNRADAEADGRLDNGL